MADTANPFDAHDNEDIPDYPDHGADDNKEEDSELESPRRKATVIDQIHEDLDLNESSIVMIVVCEPTECQDSKTGLIKWVEYKLITERSDGSQTEVFRRYSHFLWLRKLLLDEYVGVIVPPLPEKKNFGRFDASFVERRRRRLEQFLNRLRNHPFLKSAKAFQVFLNIQESELFSQALKGDSTTMSEKASSLYNAYRTTKQKMLTGMSENEDDMKCMQIKQYGSSLEGISRTMETEFLTLDNELRDVGEAWEKTAQALQAIADFEGEEGNETSSFYLAALKETCEKVGALVRDPEAQSTYTTIKLRDLFDDFSKYGLAIKECVVGRDKVYFRDLAEKATLADLEKTLEGLEGGGWAFNKDSRIESTKASIEISKALVEDYSVKLNTTTDRLQTEVSDFQKQKPKRIEENLLRYADFQIEHMETLVTYWKELKEKLTE